MDFPTALISALSEDLLFFQDGEITWNGKHHEVAGMQFNLPKLAELEQLADSYGFDGVGDFAGCFVAFLQHVEQDEALMVPRRRISSALYEPILEGDLTGITLMNLAACSKAFFVRNDAPNEYVVGFDGRLAQGIPAFFDLVCRLLWDLRQSMRSLQGMPFKVTFLQARNVDFDGYVHGSVAAVPGAQANPGTVTVESAPAVSLDRTEEAKNAVMTELAVVLKQVVDAPVLALTKVANARVQAVAQVANAVSASESADLSNATFNDGNIANGRRFKIAYPDGWTAIKNYEDEDLILLRTKTKTRPFVIVQGEATAEDDLSLRDRIVYSSLVGDQEIGEADKLCGFDDMHWAVRWNNAYDRSGDEGIAAWKPLMVWDTEVEAVNTKCLVTQQKFNSLSGGVEFDVYPYAADHRDSLRFVFTNAQEDDLEANRALVLKMAATIELDKPFVPKCMKTLEKAMSARVPVDDFVEMVDHISKPYIALRQMIFTASQYKYAGSTDDFDEHECTLAGARGIAALCNRSISKFSDMMDAYDVQVSAGSTISQLNQLLDALENFNRMVYPTTDIFDYDDGKLVKQAGIFDPTDELIEVCNRLKYAKQHGGMPSKPSGAKASSTSAVSRALSAQAKSSEEHAEKRAASNLQAQKPVETRHSDSDSAKDHQQEADTEAEALKRKELLDRAKELERYLSWSSCPLTLTEISQNGSFARGSDGEPGLMALTEALGVCVNEFETVKKVEIDGDDDKKRTAYIHVNRWTDWLAEKAQAKTGEEEEKREEPAVETAEAKNDEPEKLQANSDMDAPRMGCGCAIVALIFVIMVGCLSFPGLLGPILFMGVSVAFIVFFSILILMANS